MKHESCQPNPDWPLSACPDGRCSFCVRAPLDEVWIICDCWWADVVLGRLGWDDMIADRVNVAEQVEGMPSPYAWDLPPLDLEFEIIE